MRFSFYIARRYLASRRKKNVINLITRISVVGITVITASLIILLSAFNGIEQMIEQLYSQFDPDITIRVNAGKHFSEERIDLKKLEQLEGVEIVAKAVEDVIILQHENKWVHANLIGTDSSFLRMTVMKDHLVDGKPVLSDKGESYGLIGASLLDKLQGYIPQHAGHESLICFTPKRKIKLKPGSNPFSSTVVKVAGRMNFNREVNASFFIVPLELSKGMLQLNDELSAIYVKGSEGADIDGLKEKVVSLLGPDFVVKTNYEKNELIYKTSKTEKIIVMVILIFIFILAAFNLVASLTMLFVEKLQNIRTMISFGTTRRSIFGIFFLEGLLIAGKGIVFGFILGYLITFLQIQFELIQMPNSGGAPFPVRIKWTDAVLIFSLVSLLSVLFSYLTVIYLIKKNISK